MRTVTLEEFHAELLAQGVPTEYMAFRCPMCGTVQGIADFTKAGVDTEDVGKYVGFSCIGRFTGAGGPRAKPDGKPCNWTLGGLFRTHKLEVITDDGKSHPHFEPVTPEEAVAHMNNLLS